MFSKDNNNLRFNKIRDLTRCSDYLLSNTVSSSDDTDLQEDYSFCLLLLTLFETKSPFPFTVKKQYINDPPDFIISYEIPQNNIGLEHVIATIENYQMAFKEMMKNPDIEQLESSYYTYEKKIPKNRAFIGLKRKGEELSGSPLYGDFHIKNWVEIIINAIMKKSQAISNWDDTFYDSKELLVQVKITPMIGEKHSDALIHLKKQYCELYKQLEHHFDKVHIFSQSRVILDVFGDANFFILNRDHILKFSQQFQNP